MGGANRGTHKVDSLAWGQNERQMLEDLILKDAPATLDDLRSLMKAMEKPLRMWPKLYTLMKPIKKLLDKPLLLHQWDSEHYEAGIRPRNT